MGKPAVTFGWTSRGVSFLLGVDFGDGLMGTLVMQGMERLRPAAATYLARRNVGPSPKLASPTAGVCLGGEEMKHHCRRDPCGQPQSSEQTVILSVR